MNKGIILVALLLVSGWTVSFGITPADTVQINIILERSLNMQSTDPDSALALASTAYRLSEKYQFHSGTSRACMRMGFILYSRGQNDTALRCYRRALEIRKRTGDFTGASRSCIMMSYVFNTLGKKDSAFSILYESLRLSQSSNDPANLAYNYISLGNLCVDYGNLEASRQYYQKSVAIAVAGNNRDMLSLGYGGLANYFFNAGHADTALSYFLKKEEIDQDIGTPAALAQVKCNIALCYDQLRDYAKASGYYHAVVDEFKKLDMLSDLGQVYFNLGRMFINRELADSAIFYLEKAVALGRKTSGQVSMAESCEALSEAYALKKDYLEAYRYHQQFASLNDSLMDREKITSIAEMQTKYETEKKEQQIRILDAETKTRATQRNYLFLSTILLFLLAGSVFMGLMKTAKERKKSDGLLLNILPVKVADELKKTGRAEARHFNDVTVMFTDFKGFTTISEKLNPAELVSILHHCFTAFDRIAQKYNLEKIKTIGDSYLCAGGLPVENDTHPLDVVTAALEIQAFMAEHTKQMRQAGRDAFEIRIGIHTGPLVAGIVGIRKFAYDIWGDTVNTASRMESGGETGRINISGATFERVKEHFDCTYRGMIEAKNKGKIDMYFVNTTVAKFFDEPFMDRK